MRVIFDIGHPAHVHLFRNAIRILENSGHDVAITCSDKDVTIALLRSYGMSYHVIGKSRKGLFRLFFEMLARNARLFRFARSFKPDVLVGGAGNVTAPIVGRLLRKPSIVFDDTEHSKYEHLLMDRLATLILTPACFKKELGRKQVRYDGYHALAYLHPSYFKPDPSVLSLLNLAEGEKLVVMRFTAFQASHDAGVFGFSIAGKRRMIQDFRECARVVVTSESPLPEDLRQYQLKVSPEQLHSILYYSDLYVGDSGATTVEAALLGTPAVHCERTVRRGRVIAATDYCGTFWEIQSRYGLLYSFPDEDAALTKAAELLHMTGAKEIWRGKLDRLMAEKIDVSALMTWIVGDCPASMKQIREDLHAQDRFRRG